MTNSVVPSKDQARHPTLGGAGAAYAVLVLGALGALGALGRARRRLEGESRERGDVPGWVLVTIMTAGLVVALWAIAGPKLGQLFSDAMDSVKGP
jgi:hypothetical protein